MDSGPRPSIAERGKTIVVALSPSTYWEKELHYVSKFLIRSTRDRVILLYFSGAKGEEKMQALLASAKRRLAARSRLAEPDIETEVRPLSRHSTHSSIAQYCKEVQADILVLGAERHDHNHGCASFPCLFGGGVVESGRRALFLAQRLGERAFLIRSFSDVNATHR